ncbi:MAG TPA: NAD-dependent epimerase/dehydratase family protein [Roseiarcus sp.]|nr:NAD-dependent epimerase/dehydratase family protein [Roseiarcus sp.]
MTQEKTALILGATGGIGGETARALKARGWRIRALHRKGGAAGRSGDGLDWVRGDAMNEGDVVAAAKGVSIIVHAVNPPGYRNWGKLVLPMLDSTIAAAQASGARIVFPGAVYNFGPDAWPALREDSPQNPRTRKGAIRAEMERRLKAAAASGARALIVRAGDFFGPRGTGNSWFGAALVRPGKTPSSVPYPGREGVGHQWAYLPDVAETMARLIDDEDRLAAFEVFHMDGHWDPDGTAMVRAIGRACGKPNIKATAFPWWAVRLTSPFVTLFREMLEMRYLWREPLRMDNRRLVAFLGEEPHTPLDEAVRETLNGLGCLPNGVAPAPAAAIRAT